MYTGAAMGNVDHRRILNVAIIVGDDVAIEEKGIGTLESILISRILMYSSSTSMGPLTSLEMSFFDLDLNNRTSAMS